MDTRNVTEQNDGLASYEKKLARWLGLADSDRPHFVNALESLNVAEWGDLLRDLMAGGAASRVFFETRTGSGLLSEALTAMREMSASAKGVASEACEQILNSGASSAESRRDAVGVLGELRTERGNEVLSRLVRTNKQGLRVAAARALASSKDSPVEFWRSFDYRRLPDMAPAAIFALSEKEPEVALGILRRTDVGRADRREYEIPLRSLVRALRQREGATTLLTEAYWELKSRPEGRQVAAALREEMEQNEVALGRHPFPSWALVGVCVLVALAVLQSVRGAMIVLALVLFLGGFSYFALLPGIKHRTSPA